MMKSGYGVLLLLVLSGCNEKENQTDAMIERDGQPPIAQVDKEDAGMNAAVAKARLTVPQFIRALKSPQASQSEFSIKLPFMQDGKTEHMWLSSVTYSDKRFTAVVANEPNELTNVNIGDKVTIDEQKISDWMYVENKKLVGGFTIRAIRDAMPPTERKKLDREFPFQID